MIYLYGASGHGLVIQDILARAGTPAYAFLDDADKGTRYGNLPLYKPDRVDLSGQQVILAMGNNRVRRQIHLRYAAAVHFPTAIHPAAVVAASAQMGEGAVVMAGAVINPYAQVGRHVIVNTGATIDHECTIGDYAHISPNAALAGQVRVGEGAHIGIGACVIPCIKIGRWCTIGAGAVIISDVPDGATVVGNPGRIIRISDL